MNKIETCCPGTLVLWATGEGDYRKHYVELIIAFDAERPNEAMTLCEHTSLTSFNTNEYVHIRISPIGKSNV